MHQRSAFTPMRSVSSCGFFHAAFARGMPFRAIAGALASPATWKHLGRYIYPIAIDLGAFCATSPAGGWGMNVRCLREDVDGWEKPNDADDDSFNNAVTLEVGGVTVPAQTIYAMTTAQFI